MKIISNKQYEKYENTINQLLKDLKMACDKKNKAELELSRLQRDYNLNDEVEIIEEEKKIPEKLPEWATSRENKEYTNDEYHCLVVARKVDEIIDYLKSKGE